MFVDMMGLKLFFCHINVPFDVGLDLFVQINHINRALYFSRINILIVKK
jgi:hypothetical protein